VGSPLSKDCTTSKTIFSAGLKLRQSDFVLNMKAVSP
jgi:hypothetical protein